jgi:hypothetical protein
VGLPAGTYNFVVRCGTFEVSAAIAYPAAPLWTSPAIPAGTSSCVVAELPPLPPIVATAAAPGAAATPAAPWQDPLFYLSAHHYAQSVGQNFSDCGQPISLGDQRKVANPKPRDITTELRCSIKMYGERLSNGPFASSTKAVPRDHRTS